MGALKDCVDLIEKLNKSIKDRKTLDILFPVKEKLHQVSKEQLALERKIFDTERQHQEEMEKLKVEHSKEVSELQAENQKLKSELKQRDVSSINREVIRR